MTISFTRIIILGLTLAIAPLAPAQLPSLDKQPWLGYFAAYQGRRFSLGVTAQCQLKLTPLNDKGSAFGPNMILPIQLGIEEVPEDGKPDMKVLKLETLKSEQIPTDKLDQVIIRGQVSAEATFEAIIEQKNGIISIGGKILNNGQFKKNPIRFAVRTKIPNLYPWMTDDLRKNDPRKAATFLKKITEDTLEINRTTGKRITNTFDKPLDETCVDPSGPSISRIEICMQAFKDRRLFFNATENSIMSLTMNSAAPLYEGFTIHWTPDPIKDRDGKAKFSFLVK